MALPLTLELVYHLRECFSITQQEPPPRILAPTQQSTHPITSYFRRPSDQGNPTVSAPSTVVPPQCWCPVSSDQGPSIQISSSPTRHPTQRAAPVPPTAQSSPTVISGPDSSPRRLQTQRRINLPAQRKGDTRQRNHRPNQIGTSRAATGIQEGMWRWASTMDAKGILKRNVVTIRHCPQQLRGQEIL